MKTLIAAFVAFILLPLGAASAAGFSYNELDAIDRAREATVRISVVKIEDGTMRRGAGTGFVVREDGLIVTNCHVVCDTDMVMVTLPGLASSNMSYVGQVIHTVPAKDIALVKIDAAMPLPTLGLMTGIPRVGETVVTIGNPLGINDTVTVGIISNNTRQALRGLQVPHMLQTDSAINPGNSGGPLLVFRDGELVVAGVNTMIAEAPGGGLGFAIPTSVVKDVLAEAGETLPDTTPVPVPRPNPRV